MSSRKVSNDIRKVSTNITNMVVPTSTLKLPGDYFHGMTISQMAEQLDKSLVNAHELSGKGSLIASHAAEINIDPFIATAIMLHETGCQQNQCSNIARTCFNFGGQKGHGCGAYKRYNSVDEGIIGMMDNLNKNYFSHGLTTIETIHHRYAEDGNWANMINLYVNKLKAA